MGDQRETNMTDSAAFGQAHRARIEQAFAQHQVRIDAEKAALKETNDAHNAHFEMERARFREMVTQRREYGEAFAEQDKAHTAHRCFEHRAEAKAIDDAAAFE